MLKLSKTSVCIFIVTIIFLTFFNIEGAVQSSINDSLIIKKSSYIIAIEHVVIDNMRINDTLKIDLLSTDIGLAGFDLKFAASDDFFDIVEVIPGEIYDSCNWDFFNSHRINTDDKNRYPKILWQAVALANIMPDSIKPRCYKFPRKISLLKLVVTSEHISQIPDTAVPIYFFWEDCSDNTISDVDGVTLFMSYRVIDHFNNYLDYSIDSFPTIKGVQENCINPRTINKPKQRIEFQNGGVDFKLNLKID